MVKMAGPCSENAEQQPSKSGSKMDSTGEALAELKGVGLKWETANKQV